MNVVQRVNCGHNPDPVDPTAVGQDISVYFTHFAYGGVDLILLEDRKFKTGPIGSLPDDPLELLGQRQEVMLDALAEDITRPRVMFTQTMWACLETDETGRPMVVYDTNGWPVEGRLRALSRVAAARGVIMSGDTHLAALVRHSEGPVQFCGPAASSSYARWFEPHPPLPNPEPEEHTGDFIDGFGNELRVLAVANPRVSQQFWLEN